MATTVDLVFISRLLDNVTPATGSVTVTPNTRVLDTAGHILLEPAPMVSTLSAGAMATIPVVASDSTGISPSSGLYYRIEIDIDGVGRQKFNLVVPAASPVVNGRPTLNLADATPLGTVPPIVFPAPQAATIAPGTYVQVLDVTSAAYGGAKGDNRSVADGVMTAGSAVLTSTTAAFSAADVGKLIRVEKARGQSAPIAGVIADLPLDTTIVSRQSATQVTLAIPAVVSVSAATVNLGTNDTAAIQAAIDAASALAAGTNGRVTVRVPDAKRFRIAVMASTVRTAYSTSADDSTLGTLDVFYALRMKSGVDLRVDGEIYFPFVGDATTGNWVIGITATPADTGWRVSGSGVFNGGSILNAPEWIHQGIHVAGAADFEIMDMEWCNFQGDSVRVEGSQVNGAAGGALVRGQRFRIGGNTIHHGTGQAIETNSARDFVILANRIHDNIQFASGGGAEAIWLNGDNFVVANNHIRRWGSSIALDGNHLSAKGVIANNNGDDEINYSIDIADIEISANVMTRLRAAGTPGETRIAVVANTFTATTTAISIGTTSGATGLSVSGNECSGGVLIANGTDALVANNRIVGDLDVRCAAIVSSNKVLGRSYIQGADSIFISNVVKTTIANGLEISAPRCVVAHNSITTTAATQHAIFGVVSSTVDNGTIDSNTLSAPGNAINMNSPASKVGLIARHNKLLSGTLAGIAESNVGTSPLVNPSANNAVALTVQGLAGQSEDLVLVERSDGTSQLAVGAGSTTVPASGDCLRASRSLFGPSSGLQVGAPLMAVSEYFGAQVAVLKGAGGQSADFLEIRTSGNVVKSGINGGGTLVSDTAAGGIVFKDTQGTPHYWRVTISNTGVLTTTDLGTTRPTT